MDKIILYTDGGSRGNPGPSAAGVVICNEKDQPIKTYAHYLGDNLTNNQAEYQAVIFGLKKIKLLVGKKKTKQTEIELRADSELLISQLDGKYKIKDDNIKMLFMDIWNLRLDFGSMKFKHIPREQNKEADRLANQAMNEEKAQKLF